MMEVHGQYQTMVTTDGERFFAFLTGKSPVLERLISYRDANEKRMFSFHSLTAGDQCRYEAIASLKHVKMHDDNPCIQGTISYLKRKLTVPFSQIYDDRY